MLTTNSMNKASHCFEVRGKVQICSARIPAEAELFAYSDVRGEDGNRQQQTCIAELFALKGTELPGAAIDAHCVRITLRGAGLAAGMTEGSQPMRKKRISRSLESEKSEYNGRCR